MRVVSLTCSNTEIVCSLGCSEYLVGVDSHSDYPQDVVDRLPRVGPDLTIDIERVAELKPDLVLASLTVPGHETVIQGLESAGLPYIAPEPVCLNDVYDDILQIGELLGVTDRARSVVRDMQHHIRGETPKCQSASLLIQWWPKPVIAPGRLSWVEDMIQAAGLSNSIGDKDVKSIPLTDEHVKELDPDAVVISWCGVPFEKYRPIVVYRNPLWQESKFVRNQTVIRIAEAYLGRPSPRLMTGFSQLRKIASDLKKNSSSRPS